MELSAALSNAYEEIIINHTNDHYTKAAHDFAVGSMNHYISIAQVDKESMALYLESDSSFRIADKYLNKWMQEENINIVNTMMKAMADMPTSSIEVFQKKKAISEAGKNISL